MGRGLFRPKVKSIASLYSELWVIILCVPFFICHPVFQRLQGYQRYIRSAPKFIVILTKMFNAKSGKNSIRVKPENKQLVNRVVRISQG